MEQKSDLNTRVFPHTQIFLFYEESIPFVDEQNPGVFILQSLAAKYLVLSARSSLKAKVTQDDFD